jgi:hypothetical protein
MMNITVADALVEKDKLLRSLAREIAMDISPLEDILRIYAVPTHAWNVIKDHPRFQHYLQTEERSWNVQRNAHERIRTKAETMIEQSLEPLFGAMFDKDVPLNQRNEVLKSLMKLAGIGEERKAEQGEGFKLTINIGSQSTTVSAMPTPRVIEHEPDEGDGAEPELAALGLLDYLGDPE